MDPLTLSIRNLSEGEFKMLHKHLKEHPKKLQLLNLIRKDHSAVVNYDAIASAMGYSAKMYAFYTLKHRLLKDMVDYRISFGKNEIITTEERIHNLRSLLYSRDHKLLEKETRELTRRCAELDILRGVYEIHFCEYLIYYQNRRKREQVTAKMELALDREKAFNLCELEFYRIIFEYQDTFYHGFISDSELHRDELGRLRDLHHQLETRVSEFILLSSQLTFDLRLMRGEERSQEISAAIHRIYQLYIQSHIQYRFPNGSFAIECLFNKYYLIYGHREQFIQSLRRLENEVMDITGFKTYEDVLFYFLFARIYGYTLEGQHKEVRVFLDKILTAGQTDQYSERFHFYINHLDAIAWLYEGEKRKAEISLLKARNFSRSLDQAGVWIEIENALLNLTIHMERRSEEFALHEIGLLRKLVKRPEVRTALFEPFLTAATQFLKSDTKAFTEYIFQLNQLKKSTGLLYILDLREVFGGST